MSPRHYAIAYLAATTDAGRVKALEAVPAEWTD